MLNCVIWIETDTKCSKYRCFICSFEEFDRVVVIVTRNNVPRIIRRCKTNDRTHNIYTAPFAFWFFRHLSVRIRAECLIEFANRQQLHKMQTICCARKLATNVHFARYLSLNPIANEPFNLSGLCSFARFFLSAMYFSVWVCFCSFSSWFSTYVRTYVCLIKCRINKCEKLQWNSVHRCNCMLYLFIFIIYKFQAQWYDAMMWTHTNQRQRWHEMWIAKRRTHTLG